MDSLGKAKVAAASTAVRESERAAMTPSLHRVASPSPIKVKKREAQKPRLDVTAASVGALRLPTELFQLATSRTLAASHGQADLVLSKALDGIQAAATRLEAERTRLVIQSQELQIWDMAREEELGLLKAENEQLEQQLLVVSEKISKGLGRDGVLESLQFALRKARGERDAEVREADTLFNQLQDAKAAEQELRELRAALTQALLGLEDEWSAVPLLAEEMRRMRARAASGMLDPTQLNQADLNTLLRGLAAIGKQGVQLQAELQTLRGEQAALTTALDAAHGQLQELQAQNEQLQQRPVASTVGSPARSALPVVAGPQGSGAGATPAEAPAEALAEAARLRAQVQELSAKLAEYRSYLEDNQQEIEALQGDIQRLQASANNSSQHLHNRGGRSHHASQVGQSQFPTHQAQHQHPQQQQHHGRHSKGVIDATKAASSQPLHASQHPTLQPPPPHVPPQAVHGTPTRHHPSSSSPISTVNYASPPPHVAFGGGSASVGAISPSQLHQQQVAADIAVKVAELQELAVRVQRQAAEREAELAAAHESELAALRSALEAAQEAAQQELEAVRGALVTQHVQDRRQLEARLRAAAEKQIQEREAALAAAHRQALSELYAQLETLAQQHVAALAEREAALAAQHAQALAGVEARLGDLHVGAVGAQAAAAAQALHEQAARLEAQHAQQLRELEERLVAVAKRQAEELEQRVNQQHAEAATQRDAEVRRRHAERLAEQAAQLARLHAGQAAALGMQHAEALADREAELTRLHSEALALREATLLAEAEKQWREREAELREAFAAEVVEREARLAAAQEEQARATVEELGRLQAAVAEAAAREAALASQLREAVREAQAQAEQALRVQLEEVAAAAEAEAAAQAAAAHNAVLAAEAEKHQSELAAQRSQLLAEAESWQAAATEQLENANTALQMRIAELESELSLLQQQLEERPKEAKSAAAAQHAQELQAAVGSVERQYVEMVARLGREHEKSAAESRAAAQLREANLDKAVERHAREAAEARREAAEVKRMAAERMGEMQDQMADLQSLLDRERRADAAAAASATEQLDLMEGELRALRGREEALQREVVPLREEVRRCRWLVRDTQTDLSDMEQELARYKAAASPPVSPGSAAAPGPAHSPQERRAVPASPTASFSSPAPRQQQQQERAPGHDSSPATPNVAGIGAALPATEAASTPGIPSETSGAEERVGSGDQQARASPTAWADGESVAWPSPQRPTPSRPLAASSAVGLQGTTTADASRPAALTPISLPLPPPPLTGTPLFAQAHEQTPVLSQGFQQQQQQRHLDPRVSEPDLAAKLVRVLRAGSGGGAEDSPEKDEEDKVSPVDGKRSSKRRSAAAPRRALLSEGGPAAGGKPASAGGASSFWPWATPQAFSRPAAVAAQAGNDAAGASATVASASGPPRPMRRMTADDIPSGWDGPADAMASLVDWRSSDLVQRPPTISTADAGTSGPSHPPGSELALTAPVEAGGAGQQTTQQLGVLSDEEWGDLRGASPQRSPVPHPAGATPAASPSREAKQAGGSGSVSPVASVSTTSSYNSNTELCFVDEDEEDAEAQQRVLAAALAESRRVSMAEGQLPEALPLPPALVEIQQRRMSVSGSTGEAAAAGARVSLSGAAPSSPSRGGAVATASSGGGVAGGDARSVLPANVRRQGDRAAPRPDEEWSGDSIGEAENSQGIRQAAQSAWTHSGSRERKEDPDQEQHEDPADFDMEATLSSSFAALVIRQAPETGSRTGVAAAGALHTVEDEDEDAAAEEAEAPGGEEEAENEEGKDRLDEDGDGDQHYGGGRGRGGGEGSSSEHDSYSYSEDGHEHQQEPGVGGATQEDGLDMEATLTGPLPALPPGVLLQHGSGGSTDGDGTASGQPPSGAEDNTGAPAYGRAGSFNFVAGNRRNGLPAQAAEASRSAVSSGGSAPGPSPLGLADTAPPSAECEEQQLAGQEEYDQTGRRAATCSQFPAELDQDAGPCSGLSSPNYSRGGAADNSAPQSSAGAVQPHAQDGTEEVWRIWGGGVSAGGGDYDTGEGLGGGLTGEPTGSSLTSTSSPSPNSRHHHHHTQQLQRSPATAGVAGGSHALQAATATSTPALAASTSPQLQQHGGSPPPRMRSSDGIGSFRLSPGVSPHNQQQQQQPWYRSSVTAVPLMTPNPLFEDRGSARSGVFAGSEPSPPWSAADWSAAGGSAQNPVADDAPSMPSTPGSVSSPASAGSVNSPGAGLVGAPSGRAAGGRATSGSSDSEEGLAASDGEADGLHTEEMDLEGDEGLTEAEDDGEAIVALRTLRTSGSRMLGDGTGQPGTDTATPSRYSGAPAAIPGSPGLLVRQRSGKRSMQGRESGGLSPTTTAAAEMRRRDRRSSDRLARGGHVPSTWAMSDAAAPQGSSGPAVAADEAVETRSMLAAGASLGSSELRKRQRRRMGDFPSPLALSFALDSPLDAGLLTGNATPAARVARQPAVSPAPISGPVQGSESQPGPVATSPASPFDPLRQSWEFSCGVATPLSPGHRSRVQGHVVGHSSPRGHHQHCATSPNAAHSPSQPARAAAQAGFARHSAITAAADSAAATGTRGAGVGAGPAPSRLHPGTPGVPQASTPGAQLPPPVPLPASAAEARARGREVLGRVMGRVASLQGLCAHLSPSASGAATPMVASMPGSANATPRRSASSLSGTTAPVLQGSVISSISAGAPPADTAAAAGGAPAASITTVTPEIIRQLLARHPQQQHALHQQQPALPQSPLLAPDDPDLVAGVVGALEELRTDLFELEKLHQLARLPQPGATGAGRQASAAGPPLSAEAAVVGGRAGHGTAAAPSEPGASAARQQPAASSLLPAGSPMLASPAVFGASTPAAPQGIAAPAAAAAATPGGNVDPVLMAALAQTVQSQLAGQLGALQAKIADLQRQNQTCMQRGGDGGGSPASGASTAYATPVLRAATGPAASTGAASAAPGVSPIQQLLDLLTPSTAAPAAAASTAAPAAETAGGMSAAQPPTRTPLHPFSLVAVASAAASGVERGAAAAAAATAAPFGGTSAGATPMAAPAWGGILAPPVPHSFTSEPPTPLMSSLRSPANAQPAAYGGAASATPMPSAQQAAAGHAPGVSTPPPLSGSVQVGHSGAVLWANAPPVTPAAAGVVPWASFATPAQHGVPSTGGSRSSGPPSTGTYSSTSPQQQHTSMSLYPFTFGHGGPGSGAGGSAGAHGGSEPAWSGSGGGTHGAGMLPGHRAMPHQPYSPEELSHLPPGVQLFAPPQLRAAAVALATNSRQHPWQQAQPQSLPGLGREV